MKSILKIFSAVILSIILAASSLAVAEVTTITLLLASDTDNMLPSGDRGGFARLSAMVDAEKANNPNTLYIYAGDAISPSLMSSFDKGKHIIELLNMTPPDVFVPGNHEFDFGPEVYKQRMSEANFENILAANMTENGKPLAGDHKIFELNGVKLGIYGLAAEDTEIKSSPGNVDFANAVETGLAQQAALKAAGADIVVAVAHQSTAVDRRLLNNRVADVIFSGDDHALDIYYDGNIVFAEPFAQAEYLVALDLQVTVKTDEDKRKVNWWPNFRIIDSAAVEPKAEVQARIDQLENELSNELNVVLGVTTTGFDTARATVRSGESAFANLLADAMRESVGADVAITNGGGIRAGKTYQAGHEITRRDIIEELPFGNITIMINMTGAQIIAALENGVSAVEDDAGCFPQVSNMSFTANLSKPAGERVSEVMIEGVALNPERTYKVATNDYLGNGGDGYTVMREGELLIRKVDGRLMANDLMVYIRDRGSVSPAVEGRIKLIR